MCGLMRPFYVMPRNSLYSLSCFRKTSIEATCKVETKNNYISPVSFTVEPNRKFRPIPPLFRSETCGQTDGHYLPIMGPFHAIRAICADIPTTKLNTATCHSAAYHYHKYNDAALRDTVPFDVSYDYDCHRKRNVAVLRQRHWWLSTVITSSLRWCIARSAHPSRTSHAASALRGGRLTLPAPLPPFNSAFRKLQPSVKTVPNVLSIPTT